ncbi:MAG: enhanced serine sensitivity protein SseB C-terminal domain-containing protein [Anaerolineae bacterium]|nr:enhanced serine sensitivity protein SseB C-terminal domain-containing protein [Anaerolineae bacterium]
MAENRARFVPENDLEELLAGAIFDQDRQDEFFRTLLESTVFVVGHAGQGTVGKFRVAGNATFSLRQWEFEGRAVLPVFTSLTRLRAFITQEEGYLGLNARSLMTLMGETMTLVLNPGSVYGWELTPEQVQGLLDGSFFESSSKAAAPVLSPGVVAALRAVFARHPEVRAVYLAKLHLEHDPAPHLVLGVDATGDFRALVSECGMILHTEVESGVSIDFIAIDDGELSAYLVEKTLPLYRREEQLPGTE